MIRPNRYLHRLELALAIALPMAFLAIALMRAQAFVDDVPLSGPRGDDWFFYKELAVSIVNDGLSIPAIGSYQMLPHGFLYPYFLAGIFGLFGINSTVAYVVQSALVGVSGSLLWLLVKRRDAPLAGIGFLVAIGFILYVDFIRRLSFRLLSENLFLILIAIFLVVLTWAYRRRTMAGAALAGFLLGLATLSRISVTGASLAIVILTFVYYRSRRETSYHWCLLFTAGFAMAMMLLPLREYAAIGRPNFDLILNNGDWIMPPAELAALAHYYGQRALFALGATGYLVEEFRMRPHWLAVWIGVAGYVWTIVRAWRWPDLADAVILTFLPLYIGPVILLVDIENYGGRMVAAAIPLAAVLAARFASTLLDSATAMTRDWSATGMPPPGENS